MKSRILNMVLLVGLCLVPNVAAQNGGGGNQGGGGDERTRGRRDIITRYVNATNEVAGMLAKLTEEAAQGDVKQRLENAVERLAKIKTALKSDKLENSPQVQELLKEKHAEIALASSKLAVQVARITALPDANKELLELLGKL